MVSVTIDGKTIKTSEDSTILEAARSAGVHIPTLCYWKGLNEIGACRACVVEVEGYKKLFASCNNKVQDGMVVRTNSPKARKARRMNVEMILSEHNSDCSVCVRSGNCSLQTVANDLNITSVPFKKNVSMDLTNTKFPLIRDGSKCIKCMRCIQVCDNIQNSCIWDVVNTGSRVTVGVEHAYDLEHSDCTLCGQCITHCPVGALRERDDTEKLLEAIEDPDKTVMVQIAPAVRTAWGESFGLSIEEASMERLCAILKRIGVDYVFDTDFSADLTIMEEGSEFLKKLTEHPGELPLFTSCCPGWIRYCKARWPKYVPHLSTAKSPQQMFGAVVKSYFAEILGTDPKNLYSASVMPCVAKKHECAIPVMNDACGDPDVDLALTTREIVRLIRSMHIDPASIEEEPLDAPFDFGSGAGNIFGVTGGVMEAALRTANFLVTGQNPDPDAFKEVRGMDGWKEASFEIQDTKLHIAVVNGLMNADKLLRAMDEGKVYYDFVEVMACPGGCVGGGGQPIHDQEFMAAKRAPLLYEQDREDTLRFSHENPSIKAIYRDYLDHPLSDKAEKLLHTDHTAWAMPKEEWRPEQEFGI
ncbi:MAG: [FeFe] hydrogenase, group A [Eubacteriales bacterium]|nr:[FeFe] hydrogenase, group A [Eubacteriales bacterium]